MNIIFFSDVSADQVIGGAERVLRQQALEFRDRGHRVALVSRAPERDIRPRVPVRDIVEHRYQVSRRHELDFVRSSTQNAIHVFDEVRGGSHQNVGVIHQALSGFGPIIRRASQAQAWIYMCLSLAHEEYLTRTAAANTKAARVRRELNAKARLWIERLVMRRCDRVVVLSDFMWKRVVAVHHIPDSKVRLVPGAADLQQFKPPLNREDVRHRLELPVHSPILFTVRNLVPRMGLENLIDAAALLREHNHPLWVVIGGEGALRRKLEAQILRLNLQEVVKLIGFVPEDKLMTYYQAADLVVMPTLQLEGFGLVTVESLACGTPVLGTPVAALPEVLSRVDSMLIAEGSDGPALAKAIGRVLGRFRDQPSEQERLSRKGRLIVEQLYNWRKHGEGLERIIQEVCPPAYQRDVA
ncbi:MAG: glycosyltransferase family 4 protein [Nitrospiraceae bacterium]